MQKTKEEPGHIHHSANIINTTPQQAPMTYVVRKVEEGPRQICHSGKNSNIYDASINTYDVRSVGKCQEANIPQRFHGRRNKDNLKRREETKARQVCGQVTQSGQAKPARTGTRNRNIFSAWLRKWKELTQRLEARVAYGHKHANIRAGQTWDKPKSQGKEEAP